MVRSIQVSKSGGHMQVTGPRRKKPRRSLLANMAIGTGLVVATLMTASVVTLAMSVKGASNVGFETALVRPLATPITTPDRHLDVSKFSRLENRFAAAPKAARLEGAELAALNARRPETAVVRQNLEMAFARAAHEEKFAELAASRPEAKAIKAALAPAMASLVMVAPRGASAPDLVQDAAPPVSVAELQNMPPVEMAALEETPAIVEEPAPAPADTSGLPMAGPLPDKRPAAAPKPATANALAAIDEVAPQKPRKAEKDKDDAPTALAFAKPNNPMREEPVAPAPKWPGIGSKVAIYDITNGVVHMPNGTKLEAHSGIGKMRDNPKYTHVKMKGPTPPGTYKLSMREKPFHGVAAIRLTSVDGKHPQGRTGLLAHTYLLRSNPGDSHGCVAFKNYDKFLAAFRRGEVTHMVIVPEHDGRRPGRSNNILVNLFGGRDT
ncbi:DUF2778 domain-containing protein [Rhizobium sp. LCM 4573]|uniref:DUF2778 domain-containing protein n=1 Tax=Rhizobium sp. LCM 4573 TaxID=1848291 RepID=UPI0008DAAD56|nr:DUF2778 domain-containing protein [Rhizobium sp. LCM 4573]OHV76547.1 hypothetical protein LCM4573_13135 [Rhizobium sp. LCM 4573]